MGGFGWLGEVFFLERSIKRVTQPFDLSCYFWPHNREQAKVPRLTHKEDIKHTYWCIFGSAKFNYFSFSDGVGSAGELFWDTYDLRVHGYLCLKLSA